MNATKHLTLLAFVSSLTVTMTVTVACEGRDPLVTQRNAAAVIEPPPPPPPPQVRQLGTKRLFGTMPVENRFLDPLLTFSGSGWFGFANDFNSYPMMVRQVSATASPTQTPFLAVPAAENPSGATVIGQVKTATTPLHIELWVGRDGNGDGNGNGNGASFDTMDISLAGLFVTGGEQAVPLVADESTRRDVEGRTWMKFTADLDQGPLGWSWLLATDASANSSFYVGGAVATDLDLAANPNTALRMTTTKRALTASQKRMIAEVQEKTRNLDVAVAKRDVRPAALPNAPR